MPLRSKITSEDARKDWAAMCARTGIDWPLIILRSQRDRDRYDNAVDDYRYGGEATAMRRDLLALGVSAAVVRWHLENRDAIGAVTCVIPPPRSRRSRPIDRSEPSTQLRLVRN